jgi:agmatine deiminase
MAGRFTANGTSRLPTRCDLSEVVQTIARYEPVRLLARRGSGYREARREFATCPNVTVIDAPVDDFWMRDIMPTFALRGQGAAQEVVAIDWNFNGWGDTPDRPRRAGDRVAKAAATIFGVPRVAVPFVAEGGALVTDGCGTMITTRSCLLNPNRNPVRRGLDRHRLSTGRGISSRWGAQFSPLGGDGDQPFERSAAPCFGGRPRRLIGAVDD